MNNNGDDKEELGKIDAEGPGIVEGGPLDCQDCGKPMGKALAAGFVKSEGGKMYVAGICPECMVDRLGLEWREMPQTSIVVPGTPTPPGTKPS